MKTYEEFRRELMTKLDEGLLNGPVSFGKIEELAAKEYAKQWVIKAGEMSEKLVVGHDSRGETEAYIPAFDVDELLTMIDAHE